MRRKFAMVIAIIMMFCSVASMANFKSESVSFATELENLTTLNAKKTPEVTHLFTHCLVAYPVIAFAKGNEMRLNYDKDCLTVKEFKGILQGLYERGYVLVSPSDVYSLKNGTAVKKNVNLNGKKPLLLSFDDVNYYTKKMNLGMNDKLIVSNGRIATYTENAKVKINYDNDVVTILENFVEEHPDFSFNNAKGTLCLTGFDGVLGYRTNRDSPNRANEIAKAKVVVEMLRKKNWTFASHSYGHYHMKSLADNRFILDTTRWINEVENVIGKTDIYVYPYGESEIAINGEISKKHLDLTNRGFKFFWGVGGKPFYGNLPFEKIGNAKYLFMDRIPLDGYSLRNNDLSKYFDVNDVFDNSRPIGR